MLRFLAVITSLILLITPAAIGKETYYIGFLGNTTNAASISLSTALKLTVEEYNSNTNNPYTLDMAFFDETDPALVDAIKNRSNLLGVTGALNSGARQAMDSIRDTAFLSCSSEYIGLNKDKADNIFRLSYSDAELASHTCRFLIGVLNKNKIASLWSEESGEYAAMAEAFHNTALRNKIWNQYHRSVDKDRKDFTAILLKLRDDRVKNIYFAGPAWQAALLAKQSAEMNVGADFSSTRLICTGQFIKNSKAGGQGAVFAMANPSTLYGVKKFRPFLNA
ncbi:MAG: hypothetical protein LLG37_00660 [Spirochaetia bacterium]|nr:hypothetical protein [Spirochaetia bacterium]